MTSDRCSPPGGPLPFVFDYGNNIEASEKSQLKHYGFLEMDTLGVPRCLNLTLTYPNGTRKEIRDNEKFFPLRAGLLGPQRDDDAFLMPRNSRIRIPFDLKDYFGELKPGKYTLHLTDPTVKDVTVAEHSFEIAEVETLVRIDIEEFVITRDFRNDVVFRTAEMECTLLLAKTRDITPVQNFIIVKDIEFYKEDEPGYYYFDVPVDCEISNCQLDARSNLWIQVTSQGKSAVIVINLYNETIRTLVDWTDREIVFGKLRYQSSAYAWMVVAGIKGQPLMSTRTESSPFTKWDAKLMMGTSTSK